MRPREFTALFPFCGIGGGALGFKEASAHLLGREGKFRILGGVDFDAGACADFEYLTGASSLCADIAELTPEQLRMFAGKKAPDVVFLSPPCQGSSALLSQAKSEEAHYRRLNSLSLVWMSLMLETWNPPPRLVLLENVPRLPTRAAEMLQQVRKLLGAAGYVFADGYHDCGELGGLAQRRRRFLLVARHARRVPPLLYQPPKKRVRGVGEVLGPLPMPEDPAGGAMHRLPRLSWLNWVRLALIPAGGDWRDLPGVLKEGQKRREVFRRHGVESWDAPASTIGGPGSNGPEAVADPRVLCPESSRFGNNHAVGRWNEPTRTVIGAPQPSTGALSAADPRVLHWFGGILGVQEWLKPSSTVTAQARSTTGAFNVADPRHAILVKRAYDHGYAVIPWGKPSPTVAGKSFVGCGAYAVAEPRWEKIDVSMGCTPRGGGQSAYGVLSWQEAAHTITASACHDNGAFAIADPRKPPPFIPVIIAEDGTWHRPLTTLELAVLQGLPATLNGDPLKLSGNSSSEHRNRIGNAVPAPAARAIAEQMLVTLLQAEAESFSLSGSNEVWVQPERMDA